MATWHSEEAETLAVTTLFRQVERCQILSKKKARRAA